MKFLKSVSREFCRPHRDGPYHMIELLGGMALIISMILSYAKI